MTDPKTETNRRKTKRMRQKNDTTKTNCANYYCAYHGTCLITPDDDDYQNFISFVCCLSSDMTIE